MTHYHIVRQLLPHLKHSRTMYNLSTGQRHHSDCWNTIVLAVQQLSCQRRAGYQISRSHLLSLLRVRQLPKPEHENLTEPESTSLPGSGSHRLWINSSRLGKYISVASCSRSRHRVIHRYRTSSNLASLYIGVTTYILITLSSATKFYFKYCSSACHITSANADFSDLTFLNPNLIPSLAGRTQPLLYYIIFRHPRSRSESVGI